MRKELIKLRRSKNLSQTELGKAVGVSQQAISQWESGEKSPKSKFILKLSEVLGVTSYEILNIINFNSMSK